MSESKTRNQRLEDISVRVFAVFFAFLFLLLCIVALTLTIKVVRWAL